MRGKVLVTLLIPRVFGDEVEVFAADDESSVHFCGDDSSGKNSAADGDLSGERAFLIDVCALNGSLWCPEAQPNVLVPSSPTLSDSCALRSLCLLVNEDMWLLLVGALRL